MSTSESPLPQPSMRVVDVSGQSLSKMTQLSRYSVSGRDNVAAIIADGNNLFTLQGIHVFPALIQLSARDNSLVRMDSVASLTNLVTLNLQNNSLTEIDGLGGVVNLQWLCLSGNSIRTLDGLSANARLNHLDLSDNCITELADLSMLTLLKTLLLHGNAISSLLRAGEVLPASIETLSLAENEVDDLTQISSLASLKLLTQLSLMNNPCVFITDTQMFDSRPYVLYWCPYLTMLDGTQVSLQERHLSAALFPPNQPHPFSIGQHDLLVHYLTSKSPLPLPSPQALMTSSMSYVDNQENINPNDLSTLSSMTLSSLSGLEELIKGTNLSDESNQTDLLQKLKALQVIEQMISTQEQLLSGDQDAKHESKQNSSVPLSGRSSDALPLDFSHSLGVKTPYSLPSSLPTVDTTEGISVCAPGLHGDAVKGNKVEPQEEIASLTLDSCGDRSTIKEGVADLSQHTGGGKSGRGPSSEQRSKVKTSRPAHNKDNLHVKEKKREEQLRLLNEKIAQRHSKLPRKKDVATKTTTHPSTSSSAAGKKAISSTHKTVSSKGRVASGAKARAPAQEKSVAKKAKGSAKSASKTSLSSKSAPSLHTSRSAASPAIPSSWSHVTLSRDPPPNSLPSHTPPKAKRQPVTSPKASHRLHSLQPQISEMKQMSFSSPSEGTTMSASFAPPPDSVASLLLMEDGTAATDVTDLLDSTSYLIPVDGDGEDTLLPDISAMADQDILQHSLYSSDKMKEKENKMDMSYDVDSLASTLTQAYGFSTNTDFLFTLSSPQGVEPQGVEPRREEDGVKTCGIKEMDQFAESAEMMRSGSIPLKVKASSFSPAPPPSCTTDPAMAANRAATVIQAAWRRFLASERVSEEVNGTSLEACIATMYSQLHGCREELAHQASVIQLQEETILSLMKEVQSLVGWKVKYENKEKTKAATTIQKHWRGYRDRKSCARSSNVLVPPSLAQMWSVCLSLTKQVEDMSVELSSFQDVCGTRENVQSKRFLQADLPQAQDLSLSHFSSSCVLLQWTPAPTPSITGVHLQGYRVYVNGVAEGMVGPAKCKAYIEGLDPKTTYRITVRAVYNSGESCDSNPIIALLDARMDKAKVGADKEVRVNSNETSNIRSEHSGQVHRQNGDEGGESNISEFSRPLNLVDSTNCDGGVCVETQLHTEEEEAGAGMGGHVAGGETETLSQPEFLLNDGHHDIRGTQIGPSLSHSTTSELHLSAASSLNTWSTPEVGSRPPQPSTSQQEQPETEVEISSDDREKKDENSVQMPPDFDSTHLFRLVPKAHHITDETVSVMSNGTEEYVEGVSSRDTLSHERSVTSMIFGAGETESSASDDSSSDSGGVDEGDRESNLTKQKEGIEQIQKSYLSQLPPQDCQVRPEEKREFSETQEVGQTHCLQAAAHIPRQSHGYRISRGMASSVSASPPTNMTLADSTLPPHHSPLSMPHPSPSPFDDVSATSSKQISQPLHPLSDVQLHVGLHGVAVACTTALTFEPDTLTTFVGSSEEPQVASSRNKSEEGHCEEVPSEKVSVVAMGDGLVAAQTQSHGMVRENNKRVTESGPSEDERSCQVSGEQTDAHHINSSGSLGSQTMPEAFQLVTKTTQLNLQPLLGTCTQTAVAVSKVADPKCRQGIPEGVSEGASERDKNSKEKPFAENVELDASCVREDSKERDTNNAGMNNKSNLEIPVGRTGVMVELPEQLVEGFDQLLTLERLPSAANNSNLRSSGERTKTSPSTTSDTEENGVPLSESQELANRPQTVEFGRQQNASPVAAGGQLEMGKESAMNRQPVVSPNTSNSSTSSATLASLLLSQLESDLNTLDS